MESTKSAFIEFVQALGEYLTKDDSEIRAKATLCLAHALENLDQTVLNHQQLQVVNSFLTDRIEDEPSLNAVIRGLHAIIQMKNYSSENVPVLVNSLAAISLQKHAQTVRYRVYRLLEALMDLFPKPLKEMNDKFIKNYVNLTTSEKDPRNLMVSFSLAARISSEFDISNQVEDMFDIIFCYFPITFDPPKDDPYGITAADLKGALERCISASDLLAKFTIPGLIEKLNSTSKTVKLDALKTLATCMQKYSLTVLKHEWRDIYDGVKFEILHGSDEEDVAAQSQVILSTLGSKLGELDDDNLNLLDYIESVKSDSEEKLQQPQSRLALPAALLVVSVARSSTLTFDSLCQFALTIVLTKSEHSPSIDQLKGIIQIIIKFLDCNPMFSGSEILLSKFKDQVFALLSKSLLGSNGDKSLRKLSLTGMTVLIQRGLLDDSEVGLVVQYFDDIILRDDDRDLCQGALIALTKIFETYPQLLVNISYPALLAELPDSYKIQELELKQKKSVNDILSALVELTKSIQSFEVLSVRLVSKLETISHDKESENNVKYALALVTTLVQVAETFEHQQDLSRFLNKLVPILITSVVLSSETKSVIRNNFVVDAIGCFISVIIRNVNDDKQHAFVGQMLNLYIAKTRSDLITKPYDPTKLEDIPINLFVLSILPVNKEIEIVGAKSMLLDMIQTAKRATSSYTRITCLRFVAALVNKWAKFIGLSEIQKTVNDLLSQDFVSEPAYIEILSWIAKGLILRADNLGFYITDKLCDLLSDEQLGTKVASVFGVLSSDDPILSKENGLVIRLLYKQRLFLGVLPRMVDGFRLDTSKRVNYIVALAAILRFTPSRIILPHLEKILPLLVEALEVNNPLIQKAAINTIFVTILESPETFSLYINSLVPRLVTMSKTPKETSASVRVAALSCLGQFPKSIEARYIEPFKVQVLRELFLSLDDPRRDVRREAVICRQSWFEL